AEPRSRAGIEPAAAAPAIERLEQPPVVPGEREHGGRHRVHARPRRGAAREVGVAHRRRLELAIRSARRPKQKNTPLKRMKSTPGSQKLQLSRRSPATTSPMPTRAVAPPRRTKSLIGL